MEFAKNKFWTLLAAMFTSIMAYTNYTPSPPSENYQSNWKVIKFWALLANENLSPPSLAKIQTRIVAIQWPGDKGYEEHVKHVLYNPLPLPLLVFKN